MRFAFIREHEQEFSVRRMCAMLRVSKSGFYAHRERAPCRRAHDDRALEQAIRRVFEEHRGLYGAPRVHAALRSLGVVVGRHRVARLMRENRITPRIRRRLKATTTDSRHGLPVAPNRLDRAFKSVRAKNQVWAADITYLATEEGFLYLAVVIDLWSRHVIGFALSESSDTALVLKALELAVARSGVAPGLMHHSDRGVQYASRRYQAALAARGIVPSMSRKGDCWDNAPIESFFATLKSELVHRRRYFTREEARRSVFEFIEVFYNRKRLHSSLGYRTPAQALADRG